MRTAHARYRFLSAFFKGRNLAFPKPTPETPRGVLHPEERERNPDCFRLKVRYCLIESAPPPELSDFHLATDFIVALSRADALLHFRTSPAERGHSSHENHEDYLSKAGSRGEVRREGRHGPVKLHSPLQKVDQNAHREHDRNAEKNARIQEKPQSHTLHHRTVHRQQH
jgi:hypothetical protein